MKENVVTTHFGAEHAVQYDERWVRFAPIRDALNFLARMVLLGLRADARILCVGVGTGVELLDLAKAFPGWKFVAVEPSGPMLAVCRAKAEQAGIAARCEFHEGYLDTLPASSESFDAATSILVSQFLVDTAERREFFRQISTRLRPGGVLVDADLASSLPPGEVEDLYEIWMRANTGATEGLPKLSDSAWGKLVAVPEPKQVEAIIASGGFEKPILFYQALFIHGWYARTPSR